MSPIEEPPVGLQLPHQQEWSHVCGKPRAHMKTQSSPAHLKNKPPAITNEYFVLKYNGCQLKLLDCSILIKFICQKNQTADMSTIKYPQDMKEI
jgi:hypothetical protein